MLKQHKKPIVRITEARAQRIAKWKARTMIGGRLRNLEAVLRPKPKLVPRRVWGIIMRWVIKI